MSSELVSGVTQGSNTKPQDENKVIAEKKTKNYNGYSEFGDKIVEAGHVKAALFTHRCPDPDAISSMMGMQWLLLRAFNIQSNLFFDGEVSHPQNNAMVNLLDPGLKRIVDYKPEDYGLNILLDTIPENAGVGNQKISFDVCVDHHRELPANFTGVLIHKKCGSCAGIIYDMMKHFVTTKEEWLNEEVDTDTKLATALIAGVVSDTEYMMSDDATEFEFKAFSELFPFRNSNFLKQIIFFKRPKFWIDKKAEGCSEAKMTEEGFAIVGLGIIPENQRDLIADMAEEMVKWSSVVTAIAFGVVGGDRIEGSVRSLNPSLTVSDFCKKLGGKYGGGGGKHGKGAYRLPLAGFSIDPDEEEEDVQGAWESIKNRETKRISKAIK